MTNASSTGERIAVVDVLRAFALLGIVVTHAEMGFLAGPPPTADFMTFGALDSAVHYWVALLVESKFFSIFAFLFGLSFAIQLDRAGQKGRAFGGRFAWRLVLLFFIGMAHQALFNGDILMLYAVLGCGEIANAFLYRPSAVGRSFASSAASAARNASLAAFAKRSWGAFLGCACASPHSATRTSSAFTASPSSW